MPFRQMIDLPPLWLALFAALAWAQARLLPLVAFGVWSDWLGGALVVAGLVLLFAAVAELRRHRTTVIPHQAASILVTSGPYRLSRNPIYLADAMVLAGLALIWGSALGMALVPVFMAVIGRRFIRPEEARLRAAFGPAFADWAARTRRWI